MRYITGIYALQFNLVEDMGCDWHSCSLDWTKTSFKESDESIFKDFAILKSYSDYFQKDCFVANPIRVALDMFKDNNFTFLQGCLRKDFIANDKYNDLVFFQVLKLQNLKHWDKIDEFMEREYMLKWLNYKKGKRNV